MVQVGLLDWFLWLVYFVIIGLTLIFYRNSQSLPVYRYFIWGYVLKSLGGLSFALIYVYYYGGGDTLGYFKNAGVLVELLLDSPADYFHLITSDTTEIPLGLNDYTQRIGYITGQEEWFVVRVFSIFNFISFNSFLVTTLMVSTVSFLACWKLLLVFEKYATKKIIPFIAVFVTPSVIFWGSGILKDTIAFSGLALFVWLFHRLFFEKKYSILYVLLLLITGYFTFLSKSYVIILFIPSAILGLFLAFRDQIGSKVVRYSLTPILIGLFGFLSFRGVTYLANATNKYELSSLEGKVKGFHSWHTYQGGSVYDLGKVEYSVSGVISKIPQAINVTLFRPYLWEVNNIVMALGGLESFIFTLLFLRLIFYKPGNLMSLFNEPFYVMMFVYIILLAFVVGFTSFNFGALARYKIPMLSMFSFVLLSLNFDSPNQYTSDKNESFDQS